MFFSVLIPVYNVEKYLRECVDSVLSQGTDDLEILLVDDGSTDTSGHICDEYAEAYPDMIRVIHKANEGLLLTRRRALREARGDWFIHLDSDDYMMPHFLTQLRARIEESDADLVIYRIVYGNEDLTDLSTLSRLPFADGELFCGADRHKLHMQLLAGGYMTAIHQKAARRDIVDIDRDYGVFTGVSMMEDHLQSLPLLDNAQRTVFLEAPGVYYRYNGESITKKKGYNSYKAAFMSIYRVYGEEVPYHAKWNLSDEDIAKISVKHLRTLCGYIGKMAETADDKTQKKDFAAFISWLSAEQLWHDDQKKTGQRKLGRVSDTCVKLIRHKGSARLRLLYRKVLPLVLRKR